MLVEVKVPVLSESVAQATLLSWHKKQGEYVERNESLIDIETDKVVFELPATMAGILVKVIKGDGATVVSSEVIATIDTAATVTEIQSLPVTKSATASSIAQTMMPAAKKMVTEENLKADEIKGTGRGGRITKEDVKGVITKPATGPTVAAKPGTDRPEQRVPMSRLRMRVAERLVQSQSTAAILTTFNEVNMQAIIDLRTRHKERFEKEHGVKLGFTSFFVKAVVAALKKFPIVNSSVDGNDIVYHGYYDIGIAVGSPRGLVVPIIRDADRLSLAEIEMQIAGFGKRAQDGKLTIEELTGGTFSITNGGVFGSLLSTPIINPPQSAILGIHATKDRPVAENGQVVIRPMNYLALSYDHRIIDGREAVLSLVAIKEALENEMGLLFEV
ncbi:MAG: 2-oxoglutarate dehydrogenase complex dihydrolipoyllysine-residue succinyltransferase [Nitrosomonadaceae bacterium]|nr:2-oxoglutarate dehydrogenase complex dihydrolipoyllysine-residue succinyltransferase [Nitrosomonadaceae bacterium]MDW7598787.1 2-oxoglutarate dehydrogenase complex dihydrolipoyllysine-residue succinyltransferase [Nitrosomonadaceae bacterium]MDW7618549.1 2-oxoglutarate dehydrogenase complex dihydrolipoyllysine-residue succinyltransferase [Nitrosomonadaceae bacterium]MDW7647076.1 2-oxoglutarate dehydrogenase complex dihydrolipoyllysine-residue succinyltransferase [Nitrosomonadaceae bacterium]M